MINEQVLSELIVQNQEMMKALLNMSSAALPVGQKHDIGSVHPGGQTVEGPLHERGFFQDCALESGICNFTIQPMQTLLNYIPALRSNYTERKIGMLTGFETTLSGPRPVEVCEPGQQVEANYDFCKLGFPFARFATNIGTFEIDTLVREACERIYDHFFFVGDVRGVSQPPIANLDPLGSRGLITEAAVMRSFAEMARVHQLHFANQFWTGNPVNNTAEGGYREFLGLTHFITDDVPGSAALAPYLESSSGNTADCAAMNSDIKVFDACVGEINSDNLNIWALIQELEDTLYQRAVSMSLLPVDWRIVMRSTLFNELSKILPCEISSDGCINLGPALTTAPKQGNLDLSLMLSERESIRRSKTLTINGRTYQIHIDDFLPASTTGVGNTEIVSDIWFIPFSIAGDPSLFMEYVDYSNYEQFLRPIPGSISDLNGYTDAGRYHLVIQQILRCFNIDMKTEPRLIFKGSPLAGRITGVRACPIQRKPEHEWIDDPNFNP